MNKIIEENKAKDCAACSFGYPEFGKRVSWEITHRCNLACKHCCVRATKNSPDYYTREDIARIIKDFKEANITKIYLTGGEPLMFQHIFYLMELASKNDISLKIASNGILINDEIAKRLLNYNIHSILISLDSPSPCQHSEFRGDRFAFMKTANGIRALVNNGLNVKISTVLWKGNLDKIEDMIQMAIALGAYKLYFAWLIPVGRSEDNKDIQSDREDFLKSKPKILELMDIYREYIDIHIRRTFNITDDDEPCPGASKLYQIDHKGYVYPCSWMEKADRRYRSVKSIKEESITNIFEDDNLSKFRELVKSYSKKCGPGCPAISKLYSGDYEHSDFLYKKSK